MDDVDRTQERLDREQEAIGQRARPDVGLSLYQCEDCNVIIPEKRRMSVPGVRTCIACQEEREKRWDS